MTAAAKEPASPLAGCRVVVTRPTARPPTLDRRLADLGATVLSFPTIEIADPRSFDALDAALHELATGAYEWVIFLSASAVQQVSKRLRTLAVEPSVICNARIAAVGRATGDALAALGLEVDLYPEKADSLSLAQALGAGRGRVLLPRPAEAPAKPVHALQSLGWSIDEVVAYRTIQPSVDARVDQVRNRNFDLVIFTSGSTVRGFSAMVGPSEAGITPADSGERMVACIGPVTAGVARDLGFRVDAVATDRSAEGLVDAVVRLRSEGAQG